MTGGHFEQSATHPNPLQQGEREKKEREGFTKIKVLITRRSRRVIQSKFFERTWENFFSKKFSHSLSLILLLRKFLKGAILLYR